MAEVEPMRIDKEQDKVSVKKEPKPHGGQHGDTGEHAKKVRTERAPVADEGLGMSRFENGRESQ